MKWLKSNLVCLLFAVFYSQVSKGQEVIWPSYIVGTASASIMIKSNSCEDSIITELNTVPLVFRKTNKSGFFSASSNEILKEHNVLIFTHNKKEYVSRAKIKKIPSWLSIVPPLLTILLALIFKEVVSALSLGVMSGAMIIAFYTGTVKDIFLSTVNWVPEFVLKGLAPSGFFSFGADYSNLSVIVFSLLIGGMVSIISNNGGMMALVKRMARFASTPISAQMTTFFTGILIFFDDYANTLLVGKTMRPLTDKMKISREKLAYIVDSTAAPVAALAFITTWIGAELSYIESGIKNLNNYSLQDSPYLIFLDSLQFAFYPLFTLAFISILIYKNRDFGPMYAIENKSRTTKLEANNSLTTINDIDQVETSKEKKRNAVIPIFLIVLGTFAGLIITGYSAEIWQGSDTFFKKMSATIGQSDSFISLIWASMLGIIASIILTLWYRIEKLETIMSWLLDGFKQMLPAMVILCLAWGLKQVTEALLTAEYLSSWLSETLRPEALPTLVFVLAALVSFSTGSSWATMAILFPIIIGLSWQSGNAYGLDSNSSYQIMINCIACVLSGSVMGDHCSPISDTTIMSSMSCDCNHLSHVKTQAPYAMVVGLVSIVLGTLPSSFGVPFYLTFPLGIFIIYLVISLFGQKH